MSSIAPEPSGPDVKCRGFADKVAAEMIHVDDQPVRHQSSANECERAVIQPIESDFRDVMPAGRLPRVPVRRPAASERGHRFRVRRLLLRTGLPGDRSKAVGRGGIVKQVVRLSAVSVYSEPTTVWLLLPVDRFILPVGLQSQRPNCRELSPISKKPGSGEKSSAQKPG